MKFKVLSRQAFEEFKSDEPFIVISITDPRSERVRVDNLFMDILYLQFYDLDDQTKMKDFKLFTDTDAKNILYFVDYYKSKVDLLVVHCEAGISRSVGVAGALSKIYNRSDEYYFKHYLPNMLVYRTLLNNYEEKNHE